MIKNRVVATAESEAESIALIKASEAIVQPVATAKKSGIKQKYFTEAQKRAAKARWSKKYYHRNKAKIAAAKAAKTAELAGTPVVINKVDQISHNALA